MDAPVAKKRKLAPKSEAPQAQPAFVHEPPPPPQHYQVQEVVPVPPPPERHEFESFARHLQDAAMLIYRQSQKSPYAKVSVLLLRWEEDNAVESDLVHLEQVLRDRYNYRTERWNIPALPSPSLKVGVRMTSFLENTSADHLLILYYAGHAYTSADGQVYWASDLSEDAPRIKWDGFRCLFEEAQSDVLLLLDTSGPREAPAVSSKGSVKKMIVANGPEYNSRESGGRSFTANLADAFTRLGEGQPFTAEQLYRQLVAQRQQELMQNLGLMNGATKSVPPIEKLPHIFTLSSGNGQSIGLFPLIPPTVDADGQQSRSLRQEQAIHPNAVADLTFDEPRVLVCTTFVGEASQDMSSFNQWLHNTPAIASRIAVEGMFLGPPTMLLISMPIVVWNVVQHDKVCCFLGYINSHNMTHIYKDLVGEDSPAKASAKDVEDGRILLEAREVASTTPVIHRHELNHRDANHAQALPETPIRHDGSNRIDPMSLPQSSASAGLPFTNSTPNMALGKHDDVEDSAEMQEAAEQLKALSHVRHMSDEAAAASAHVQTLVDQTPDIKQDNSVHEPHEFVIEEAQQNTPSARPKQRRSLQKATPKQETRCDLCSHAPFKDSSSLRKHIAAAHTRPFPCAFAFAGCMSTFGSKNEWKRHIASQHLCLQYYRCSSCPQSTAEGKGNEFNRKDLFTQHLRRMHAPFAIKKAIAKGDSKLQVEWETHVKEMQISCLVTRRQPPQRSACPKPDCASVFEGPTSWDEWTEHVGRHMEKGEAGRLAVDRLLAKWALDEGIIERKDDGEYRLCTGSGTSGEKELNNSISTNTNVSNFNHNNSNNHNHHHQNHNNGNNHNHEHDVNTNANNDSAAPYSDENDREQEPEEKTIVAASTVIEHMDIDG